MSNVRQVTLSSGEVRYRVRGDVTSGPHRKQKCFTFTDHEEALLKAAELDRLGLYGPRRLGRQSKKAADLGLVAVAELLASEECDGKCLTAFASDDCECRCGGAYHGALTGHYVIRTNGPRAEAVPLSPADVLDDMELTVLRQGLKAVRRHRGLSQEALAELAGMHGSSYCLIENGKRQPSLPQLIGIVNALGLRGLTIEAVERIFAGRQP